MKKYTLFLFVFALFVTLLGFNVNSAKAMGAGGINSTDYGFAPGCTSVSQAFSTTTGQPCGTASAVVVCPSGDLFSSVTGQKCTTNIETSSGVVGSSNSIVTQFNNLFKSNFKIGLRGNSDVKALQQFLKDQGYYFGKIDGSYGKISARAVSDFQSDYNIANPSTCGSMGCLPGKQTGPTSPTTNSASVQLQQLTGTNTNTIILSPISGTAPFAVTFYGLTPGASDQTLSFGDGQYLDTTGSSSGDWPARSVTHTFSSAGTYTAALSREMPSIVTSSVSITVKEASTTSQSPSITVLSPNGGEQWAIGSTHMITWNSNNFSGGVVYFDLIDSRYNAATEDNQTSFRIANAVPNTGSYAWTPSSTWGPSGVVTPGSQYKIRISAYKTTSAGILDYDNLVQGDVSNDYFTITN